DYVQMADNNNDCTAQRAEGSTTSGANRRNQWLANCTKDNIEVVSYLTSKAALIIFEVIAIACMAIGIFHLDLCRAQPMIPLYFVVAGVLSTVTALCVIAMKQVGMGNGSSEHSLNKFEMACYRITTIVILFRLLWFVIGTIWVFGADVTFEISANNHCDKLMYTFAESYFFICYGCFALSCCICGSLRLRESPKPFEYHMYNV
ncbi:hypothetical protein PFISCL1PPCAC_13400, partial [Pristionchus fissidentatus]